MVNNSPQSNKNKDTLNSEWCKQVLHQLLENEESPAFLNYEGKGFKFFLRQYENIEKNRYE